MLSHIGCAYVKDKDKDKDKESLNNAHLKECIRCLKN
jgi:hypothetical protein